MRPVKNKRRIDPRYFLNETADRDNLGDDLVAEGPSPEKSWEPRTVNSIVSNAARWGQRSYKGEGICLIATGMKEHLEEFSTEEWHSITPDTVTHLFNAIAFSNQDAEKVKVALDDSRPDVKSWVYGSSTGCKRLGTPGPAMWGPLLQKWTSRLSPEVQKEIQKNGIYKVTLETLGLA